MRAARQLVSRAERTPIGVTGTRLEPSPVNVRVKIAALWASMLFVFAYVDLFSLYRPDFRADVEAGEVGGFAVNQTFLLATTVYVVIPSLMVFCVLVLRPRLNRILNIALAMVYAVSILAATIGEWTYYLLGSLIEAALLAAVLFYAWTWPKEIGQTA
jgi:membrane protein DedA with SNARE-associated domain